MTRPKGTPPKTRAGKLRKFYAENPDAELSAKDAATMLGTDPKTAEHTLHGLAYRGALERRIVYRVRPRC